MITNQLLVQYVTLTLVHPDGKIQCAKLTDFIRPENITEEFANEIISNLSEKEINDLKRIAIADYQFRGEKLIFLD